MPADAAAGSRAAAAFDSLSSALRGATRDSLVRQFNGCVVFDLGDAGKWTLDLRTAAGDAAGVRKGVAAEGDDKAPSPDLTVSMKEDVFLQLINGELDPTSALVAGAPARRTRARERPKAHADCACVSPPAWAQGS